MNVNQLKMLADERPWDESREVGFFDPGGPSPTVLDLLWYIEMQGKKLVELPHADVQALATSTDVLREARSMDVGQDGYTRIKLMNGTEIVARKAEQPARLPATALTRDGLLPLPVWPGVAEAANPLVVRVDLDPVTDPDHIEVDTSHYPRGIEQEPDHAAEDALERACAAFCESTAQTQAWPWAAADFGKGRITGSTFREAMRAALAAGKVRR